MRILLLPDEMINALEEGKISEGHTRPLLMLSDRPEEQLVLFKEIMANKLSVREAESMSRRVATEKIRNKDRYLDPAMIEMEKNFTETLGTRVRIEKGKTGGKVTIDFFSPEDLRSLLEKLVKGESAKSANVGSDKVVGGGGEVDKTDTKESLPDDKPIDDRSKEEIEENTEELYSLKDFSV
jgi:hypothetical protein